MPHGAMKHLNATSKTEKQFLIDLIKFSVSSQMWLVATLLGSTGLEAGTVI